jgi:shikimate kinase
MRRGNQSYRINKKVTGMKKSNIVLIGMPSSGKSTIGGLLSKELDMEFVDTDTIILNKENKPLKDIVVEDGLESFLKIQETHILELDVEGFVVATGGSVIYSESAMKHLGNNGFIVFLKTDFSEIDNRVTQDRRFARNEGQSLGDLYKERMPLYEKYADITIECSQKQVEEILKLIKSALC